MEDPQQLHARKAFATQLLELRQPVLANVPRVARTVRARRREGEDVGRGDIHRTALAHQRSEVRQGRLRVGEVLDRLQEDDRVGRLREGLDQRSLEAQVRAPVAQARVLVRVRVGIDANDLRRLAGE